LRRQRTLRSIYQNTLLAFVYSTKIRLECPAEIRMKRAKYWGNPDHLSETDINEYLDRFDVTFDTSGSIEQTRNTVINWLRRRQWDI